MTVVDARFGDRDAAADAATAWRRFLLILVASAMMIVGVFTADHVEAFNTSEHGVIASFPIADVPLDGGVSFPTTAGSDASGVESVGEQVLLICTILGLTVAFLRLAITGPIAGAIQRQTATQNRVALATYIAGVGVVRLDRTALCIIRT